MEKSKSLEEHPEVYQPGVCIHMAYNCKNKNICDGHGQYQDQNTDHNVRCWKLAYTEKDVWP